MFRNMYNMIGNAVCPDHQTVFSMTRPRQLFHYRYTVTRRPTEAVIDIMNAWIHESHAGLQFGVHDVIKSNYKPACAASMQVHMYSFVYTVANSRCALYIAFQPI